MKLRAKERDSEGEDKATTSSQMTFSGTRVSEEVVAEVMMRSRAEQEVAVEINVV